MSHTTPRDPSFTSWPPRSSVATSLLTSATPRSSTLLPVCLTNDRVMSHIKILRETLTRSKSRTPARSQSDPSKEKTSCRRLHPQHSNLCPTANRAQNDSATSTLRASMMKTSCRTNSNPARMNRTMKAKKPCTTNRPSMSRSTSTRRTQTGSQNLLTTETRATSIRSRTQC